MINIPMCTFGSKSACCQCPIQEEELHLLFGALLPVISLSTLQMLRVSIADVVAIEEQYTHQNHVYIVYGYTDSRS